MLHENTHKAPTQTSLHISYIKIFIRLFNIHVYKVVQKNTIAHQARLVLLSSKKAIYKVNCSINFSCA